MIDRFAVILAGGRGERFWPLSRTKRPKQLLDLIGDKPLIAQAVDRLSGLVPPEKIIILTNADLVQATRQAVPAIPADQILGEPVGRDTAPAVALAAAIIKARSPDAVFAILTADHVIGEIPNFQKTLSAAMDLAAAGPVLVTIGIRPYEPSTAYGYIELGDRVETRDGIAFRKAQRFVEKPDRATADRYLASGRFVWNSGMFIWSVSAIENALIRHHPELGRHVAEWATRAGGPDFPATIADSFSKAQKISIDYAVMEKADNILVAEANFEWDDVGSWPALERHFPGDADGNVFIGDVAAVACSRNIVYSRGRLTALVGMEDAIIVQADDVTLVCRRDRVHEIKTLLAQLREKGRNEVL